MFESNKKLHCYSRHNLTADLTGYDGDIPAFIPEKYFLMVNFDAL